MKGFDIHLLARGVKITKKKGLLGQNREANHFPTFGAKDTRLFPLLNAELC